MATRIVGQSMHRVDAHGKVTGEALYPGDLEMEGMLHMKILFSERAHARILSIDTSEAEAVPGVVAIFTAKDVPVNEYGLIMPDQPVLCGPGSAKEGADIVRTTMDNIALVVAETEEAAAKARALIRVEYEDLPAVFDPFEAMAEGAPQLHPNVPNNVITHYKVRTGDLEAGWAEAEVVVEGTYTTKWQEHAYLQPEAGLAYVDEEGRVTVQVGGQWTHEDQEQISHALGLPMEKVRVIYPAIGGAFGGREDMSVQIVLALAAVRLGRPVKIIWSREESIRGHHKRHPYVIKSKWGAKRDGTLVAAEVDVVSDAGGYVYTSTKVLGNATMMCIGPYHIPNVKVDARTVYTNNIPTGAFRGFGGPQGALAAENQMNKLAAALGMDPVELRMKNVLREGVPTHVGTPLSPGVTMPEVIEACAERGGWQRNGAGWTREPVEQPANPAKRRGIGFTAGFKNVGFSFGAPETCNAIIELRGEAEIDEVILYHASAEVGQGTHTVLRQMAAEAVGVPLEKVRLVASDTLTSGSSGSVSASRMTFMSGNSIRGAAEKALEAWQNEDRPAIGNYTYHAPKTTMFDPETGHCTPNFSYGYVAQMVEVEVDVETGFVEVLNVICADDVGKAINPQQVEGQIEGAIVQAHGYALMEDFQMRDGHVLTQHLSTYLIPTVLDVPHKVDSLILEYAEPNGPFGARGMAEMPFIPYTPAIAAAIYDATGVWFDDQPMTPQRLVSAFRKAGLGA
ncbi:MAG TPA: xanthine dehydrogenase family protein molybdopterin-binding subunit [Aggregatilineales bacterium]|nr:xanthine dehydrogenase family protein molybdopterin-binding subunit [Aggregatilineales bacterium]